MPQAQKITDYATDGYKTENEAKNGVIQEFSYSYQAFIAHLNSSWS